MARVKVQELQRDTQVKPTASIVDTYYRPEMPMKDGRMEMLAGALSRFVPGIATKAGEEEKKSQMAMAERQRLEEDSRGWKVTKDNIYEGTELFQDSPIALKHLQVLRAQAWVAQQTADFNNQLFNTGGLTDQEGNPFQPASRGEVEQAIAQRVGGLTSFVDPDDEYIISAISPKINEWKHNTLAKWDANESERLKQEQTDLFGIKIQGILKNAGGKTQQQLELELTGAVDSYYRLGNPKATGEFVDQMIAIADTHNNIAVLETALRLRPGNKDLPPTMVEKLVEAKEKIIKEVQTEQAHNTTIANAQRKKAKEDARSDLYTILTTTPGITIDHPKVQELLTTFGQNGGDNLALRKSAQSILEKFYTARTPANDSSNTNIRTFMSRMSLDPNRGTTVEEWFIQTYAKATQDINSVPEGYRGVFQNLHPSDITELRTFARSIEKVNNVVYNNPTVKEMRNTYVGNVIGTKGQFAGTEATYNRKVDDLNMAFNARYQKKYRELYEQTKGNITDTQLDSLGVQVKAELMAEFDEKKQAQTMTQAAHRDAATESLKAYNSTFRTGMFTSEHDYDEVEKPAALFGLSKEDSEKVTAQFNAVAAEPYKEMANGAKAWEVFDAKYGAGAFAWYARNVGLVKYID